MILGVPFMVIIASCGGFFLSDQALRPITQIISTAQEIHHQEIERRINYQGSLDEVGHLALTLDRMLDRLQVAIEHERRFISDASHELRTPLTIIKGRISVTLSRPRTRREYIQTLVELEQQVDSLIRLAHGLLFLSRLEQEYLVKERVDITNLLTLLVEQVQSLARDKDIPLTATIAPNLILEGNWDYLTSLFLNLLDNAYKYTPETGEIFLEATQLHGRILVHITNTDVGIPPQALPHLFERFYRIQEDRSRYTGGAGLGLAIAKEIVYLHGAEITVTSQAGEFTRFSLSFAAL
jgi:signal transduction histidine kinase